MTDRLPTGVLVSAVLRRVNDAGGFGTVLAKGDSLSGMILVVGCDRNRLQRVFEREIGPSGATILVDSTPTDDAPDAIQAYWQRRRARDPDLWVIELDIAAAERFAAEILVGN